MIELYGPNGLEKGLAHGATNATIDTAIEAGGTYTVLVSDANRTGNGTYQLYLTRGTIAPAGANVLVNGSLQTGSVPAAGASNSWTFAASVGDNIVVRAGLISGNLSPWVRLYGPDGVELGQNAEGSAGEVAVQATESGTFTVGDFQKPGFSGFRARVIASHI